MLDNVCSGQFMFTSTHSILIRYVFCDILNLAIDMLVEAEVVAVIMGVGSTHCFEARYIHYFNLL